MEMTARLFRNDWRPWHLYASLALVSVAIYATWQAWGDLIYRAWRDEESSQILLVPIVIVLLIWVRRARLLRLHPQGGWVGTLLVGIGWLLYASGDTYLIETFWFAGAILMVLGALLSVLGRQVMTNFLPVLGVLVFLIPIPGTLRPYIAGPLQTATAAVVEWLFVAFGFTVSRSGNLLRVNGEPVAIAEACNGLRMIFALILVSYAFVFTTPFRGYVRVILLVASPIFAIVCNVVRLVPTLWAYGYTSRAVADALHDVGGWAMLGVSLFMLIGLLRLMEWMELPIRSLGRATR